MAPGRLNRRCYAQGLYTSDPTHRRPFLRPRSAISCENFHLSVTRFNFVWNIQQRRLFSVPVTSAQYSPVRDYWTNDGTIEGVWMFSRHGDRTPSRPLSPKHRRDEEAAFWVTKLPIPDSATLFESYSRYFPVTIPWNLYNRPPNLESSADGANSSIAEHTFIDVARNPFGFLTSKGVQQLASNGQRFFNRYNNHAHHLPGCQQWKSPQDFLDIWNVQIYSTNYLRTIMSVQSFLDGMFGTQCYDPGSIQDRKYDPCKQMETRIPSLSSLRRRNESDVPPLVTIQVRDLRNDPLNAFDRNPGLISELVSEVMMSQDFQLRDGKAASLAARLANILPGLVRHPKPGGSNTDYTSRAPSGINWVEAADHFVCRAAHNLSLTKFSDFETDEYEQTLQAMSYPTLAHLSWRFRKWYQHERLLAVIAAPPLREIANQIVRTPHLSMIERHPFVIYSCHDITILGLLYAIGADFLAIDGKDNDVHHTSGDDTGRYVVSIESLYSCLSNAFTQLPLVH
jgi:Histidine phosphatase superfamily (branch 2)